MPTSLVTVVGWTVLLLPLVLGTERPRVIVVGAGIAGLQAGRILLEDSHNVTVLEATGDVGGRIKTIVDANYPGKPLELGAYVINDADNSSNPLLQYCEERNISTVVLDWYDEVFYMGKEEKVSIETAKVKDSQFSDFVSNVREAYQNRKDEALLDAGQRLFHNWTALLTQSYHKFISVPMLEEAAGGKVSELSASHSPSDSYSNQTAIPGGMRTIVDHIVKGRRTDSPRLNVKLNQRVEQVSYPSNSTVVTVTTVDGTVYEAEKVIIAVPLGVLKAGGIRFLPPLPEPQQSAIKAIGFGSLSTVALVFDKVFWPKDADWIMTNGAGDSPGFLYSYVNQFRVNGIPALIGTVVGAAAEEADRMSDDALQAKATHALTATFGDAFLKAKLKSFKRYNWSKDPNFLGSASFPKVGVTDDNMEDIRKSVDGKIYFVGEHTAFPDATGTVHGAFISGMRGALEVVNKGISAQSSILTPTILFFVLWKLL